MARKASAKTKEIKKMEAKRKKAKLGTGTRFDILTEEIAKKGNVKNPAAVAASIGRKKYGSKKMAAMAAKGRKKKK